MTITEFLLARIAEDEAEAQSALREYEDSPPLVYDMAQVPMLDAGDPDRVLAECEAKRRIVGRASVIRDSWEMEHERPEFRLSEIPYVSVSRREKSHAFQTLCDLAAIYESHPDYDEGWRP